MKKTETNMIQADSWFCWNFSTIYYPLFSIPNFESNKMLFCLQRTILALSNILFLTIHLYSPDISLLSQWLLHICIMDSPVPTFKNVNRQHTSVASASRWQQQKYPRVAWNNIFVLLKILQKAICKQIGGLVVTAGKLEINQCGKIKWNRIKTNQICLPRIHWGNINL